MMGEKLKPMITFQPEQVIVIKDKKQKKNGKADEKKSKGKKR